MSHYLDTNVVLPLIFPDVHSARVSAWLARNSSSIGVSHWVACEFHAVVNRLVRTGALTAADGRAGALDFDEMLDGVFALHDMPAAAGPLATALTRDPALKLSAADALHLACAVDGGHRLVTLDQRLADAARACGFALEVPEA